MVISHLLYIAVRNFYTTRRRYISAFQHKRRSSVLLRLATGRQLIRPFSSGLGLLYFSMRHYTQDHPTSISYWSFFVFCSRALLHCLDLSFLSILYATISRTIYATLSPYHGGHTSVSLCEWSIKNLFDESMSFFEQARLSSQHMHSADDVRHTYFLRISCQHIAPLLSASRILYSALPPILAVPEMVANAAATMGTDTRRGRLPSQGIHLPGRSGL